MKKVKVKLIFKAIMISFAGVTLISGSLYLYKYKKAEAIAQVSQNVDFINQLSQSIDKRWLEGDIEELWIKNEFKCEALKKLDNNSTDDSWLQCNPLYLDCYIKNHKGKIELEHKGQKEIAYLKKFKNGKYVQIETRNSLNHHLTPVYATHIKFNFDKKSSEFYSLLLEDKCKDIYLPQRIYGQELGDGKRKFDYKWDNLKRHIFVDKYQVTNLDINLWIDKTKNKIPKRSDESKLSRPASHLTLKQMRSYCAFRGKKLMTAHVFDAMSFHPGDEDKIRNKYLVKRPYPWSKRKSKVFLYEALKGKDAKLTKENCRKAFVKECMADFRPRAYDTRSASWVGAFQLLGGVMETMDNSVIGKQNLLLSSQYLSASSPWQQLGKRIYWDGLGNDSKNFDFPKGINLSTYNLKYEVGFRCMKEVYNE
jgi:hypothetical protein